MRENMKGYRVQLRACSRCGGDLCWELNDDVHCIQCGFQRYDNQAQIDAVGAARLAAYTNRHSQRERRAARRKGITNT